MDLQLNAENILITDNGTLQVSIHDYSGLTETTVSYTESTVYEITAF